MKSMRDISRLTGYSIATISRYINDSGYVSEEAKEKIQQVIDEENYRPNKLAKSLFTEQTNTIGVIIKDIVNPYYTEFLSKLDQKLYENDITMLVSFISNDQEKEINSINNFIDMRVDGIFIFGGILDPEFYESVPIKIVGIEQMISPKIPFVTTNDIIVGEIAAKYLLDKKCMKFAMVTSPNGYDVSRCREKGFKEVLESQNIKVDVFSYTTIKYFKNLAIELIEKEYDGIFIWNDFNAIKLSHYLVELQANPHIISCDGISILKYTAPHLKSIKIDKETIIEEAIKLLTNKQDEEIHVLVSPLSL